MAGRLCHGHHRVEKIHTPVPAGIPEGASGRLTAPPLLWPAVVLVMGLCHGAWAQPRERVANTSLLVDLTAGPPPATISASGLYTDTEARIPSPGLVPFFSVNSPLWSDGAHKVRYLALPGLSRIEFSRDGHWRFPPNTVLVKSFYLDMVRGDPSSRRIVETRLLIKAGESERWEGFSYRWNEAGTDAELLIPGGTRTLRDRRSRGPGRPLPRGLHLPRHRGLRPLPHPAGGAGARGPHGPAQRPATTTTAPRPTSWRSGTTSACSPRRSAAASRSSRGGRTPPTPPRNWPDGRDPTWPPTAPTATFQAACGAPRSTCATTRPWRPRAR